MEQLNDSKLRKEYIKAVYSHPADLTSKMLGCLWITSWTPDCQEQYQQPKICRWYHSNGRKWRGTKEPYDEGERGECKSWLKAQHSKNKDHNFQSHHFMANRRGEKWKQWQTLFFSSPKSLQMIDCNHEIKRLLLLGRKAVRNLDSILKSKHIILLTKVHLVKGMVFLVVMHRCESWTIKKSEC